MQYLSAILRFSIVVIGGYMIYKFEAGTPPFLSGIAFILVAFSLCVNRLMAIHGTKCLISFLDKK